MKFLYLVSLYSFLSTLHQCDSLKILFTIPCYHGHVNPDSYIARALADRSHTVDVLLSDGCKKKFEHKFIGANDIKEADFDEEKEMISTNPFEAFEWYHESMVTNNVFKCFDFMDKFLAEKEYDVVVSNYLTTGTLVACKKHKLPVAFSMIGPLMLPWKSNIENGRIGSLVYIGSPLVPDRVKYDLDCVSWIAYHKYVSHWIHEGLKKLHAEIPLDERIVDEEDNAYQPWSYAANHVVILNQGPPDINLGEVSEMERIDNQYYYGYTPDKFVRVLEEGPITEFNNKCEKPLVYLCFGTLFEAPIDFLQELREALESQSDYCIIWSVKHMYRDTLMDKQTKFANLLIGSQVAQQSLLLHPKMKVFISHAGANSLQESVYAEVPMLVHPFYSDQPLNSANLVRNGVALYLENIQPQEMLKKLDMILSEPIYSDMKERLKKYKNTMVGLGGFDAAADLVEKLANGTIKPRKIEGENMLNLYHVCTNQLAFDGGLLVVFLLTLVFGICKICCRGEKVKTN